MSNPEHIKILEQGVEHWNKWYENNSTERADLSEADLSGVNLSGIDLGGADLSEANLVGTNFSGANLSYAVLSETYSIGANFSKARLHFADLSAARLSEANMYAAKLIRANMYATNLVKANMVGADLFEVRLNDANLSGADLRGASFIGASLIGANFNDADISGCRIFGISAWQLKVNNLTQANLVITDSSEPEITVDNLEIAQFMYLLLHNEKLRGVIDTLTTKSILILGRFTKERKAILDAIRDELRKRGYLPILFDFEKPASRDLTETISTLAHLSRFIIADITDAKSIPQELQAIVPNLPSVAIQPIILAAQREYAMFEHFRGYRSVLELYPYDTPETLIASLGEKVIEPAEAKVDELRPKAL